MMRATSKLWNILVLVLLVTACGQCAHAASRTPQRRGKVIVIRGAFTVFSLGLNELGDKLARYGLDVEVIADVSAGRETAKLVSAYRRNPNLGPIVFIGHSRGAQLAPDQARTLQQYKVPVDLIVMVDNVHPTTIPSNVKRCVNLYQSNTLGVLDGEPAKVDSRYTELVNRDIDQLKSRSRGGMINHFNIDSSPWIHDLVVAEVLKVCPAAGSRQSSNTAAKSNTAAPTRSPRSGRQQVAAQPEPARTASPTTPARPRSASGLQYPRTVTGGFWARSTPGASTVPADRSTSPSRATTAPPSTRPQQGSRPSASPSRSRSQATRSLRSNSSTTTRAPARTAQRPTEKSGGSTSSSSQTPAAKPNSSATTKEDKQAKQGPRAQSPAAKSDVPKKSSVSKKSPAPKKLSAPKALSDVEEAPKAKPSAQSDKTQDDVGVREGQRLGMAQE